MTNIFSKFNISTDKAKKLLLSSPQTITNCFKRNHFNMPEESHKQQNNNSLSKIQSLYELCKQTLTPSITASASPQAVHELCSLLDTIGPSDVGLKEEQPDDDRGHGFFGLHRLSRVARWAQPITYIDIHECESFTVRFVKMCIFCFPTSSVIPLHDHPGMTVLSKVLYGSLHVKAYDWVEPIQEIKKPGYSTVRLAKLAVDEVIMEPKGKSVLFPTRGNIHCFTALTPCAVLDILTPPYNEVVGRKCTYYHDHHYSIFATGDGSETANEKAEDYVWLEEIDTPDDLYMRQGVYAGPAVAP